MMKIVAILLLMGVALAAAAKPKPCCTPDQWEGMVGTGGGVVMKRRPSIVGGYAALSYDFKNKRLAMNQTMYDGRKLRRDMVIADYAKKALYIIVKGKCYKKTLKKPMRKFCVPANATYNGALTFGLKPSLTADSWAFTYKNRRARAFFQMSFTIAAGCIPIGESVTGMKRGRKGPVAVALSTGFFNISGGIKDAKIFTPPKSCSAFPEDFGEQTVDLKYYGFSDVMADLYDRFIDLF